MHKIAQIPFGLYFEEFPIVENSLHPIYDEDEEISVIFDENGRKIPVVECYGAIGTKTVTFIHGEETDDDQDSSLSIGTRTLTHVQDESSDSDEDSFSFLLGTKTATAVQPEQSDEDSDHQYNPGPIIATGTFTKIKNENSDSDD